MGGPAMLRRLASSPAGSGREARSGRLARPGVRLPAIATNAVAAFAVADAIRPGVSRSDSPPARSAHRVVMMTGDAKAVAMAVAATWVSTRVRGGAARRQGRKIKSAPEPGQASGDGRRRRQRRPGTGHCRCRDRNRCGHRCRGRSGRRRAVRSDPVISTHHRAEPGDLSKDDSESLVGGGLQHRRDPAGGRRTGPAGSAVATGCCGCVDVRKHRHCGNQCTASQACATLDEANSAPGLWQAGNAPSPMCRGIISAAFADAKRRTDR